MSKINFVGIIILVLAWISLVGYVSVYWFMNDHLTMMQLFKTTWKVTTPLFILKIIGLVMAKLDYLR